MMRLFVLAAVAAAGFAVAPPASAYCDPDYYPRCTNDCKERPLDLNNLPDDLFRMCPE